MEGPLRDIAPPGLRVIETLRYDPVAGLCRLPLHLDRAESTCARLRIPFERRACRAALEEIAAPAPLRCRLAIDMEGRLETGTAPLEPSPPRWRVSVSRDRVASGNPWLGVKTTERGLYDAARARLPAGVQETLFLNERGEVCEGTITTVFARLDDRLCTPPLACGLLPGVLRAEMLGAGRAEERVLVPADLEAAEALFVGNSLRGLIPAELVPAELVPA